MQPDVVTGGESQLTGHPARQVADCLRGLLPLPYHGLSVGQQGPPGLCEANMTANTIKQGALQLLLKQGNTFTDRRLGQVQALGGKGKRTLFSDQ